MSALLTAREREVAALLEASRTTKQIAKYLGITMRRVSQLIASVASKIEADPNGDTRVAIALWWHDRAA